MSEANIQLIRELFQKVKLYLKGLYLPNQAKLVNGPRKKAFIGLISLMESFDNMFKMYVENHHLEYLLTFKFSKDHLETFFSIVRASNGAINNPTSIQVYFLFLLSFIATFDYIIHA